MIHYCTGCDSRIWRDCEHGPRDNVVANVNFCRVCTLVALQSWQCFAERGEKPWRCETDRDRRRAVQIGIAQEAACVPYTPNRQSKWTPAGTPSQGNTPSIVRAEKSLELARRFGEAVRVFTTDELARAIVYGVRINGAHRSFPARSRPEPKLQHEGVVRTDMQREVEA